VLGRIVLRSGVSKGRLGWGFGMAAVCRVRQRRSEGRARIVVGKGAAAHESRPVSEVRSARVARIAEIDDPTPGPHEIVIDVRAAAITFPDALMIEDKYQFKPKPPFVPGGDVGGRGQRGR
jgi:hypothetical protein